MKVISLAGSLTGKDSFNYLYARNNSTAKAIAKAAADADNLQQYSLEQWNARNEYDAIIRKTSNKSDPAVIAAANRLKKAEDALKANKPKYDANAKKFQDLLPKLETEYKNALSRMVADQAQLGREYPPKPKPSNQISLPEVMAQGAIPPYDPNYATANSMFRPPVNDPNATQVSDIPAIVNDPERVTTQVTNRRGTPKKPKPQPPARRRPVPPRRGTVNNSNVPKNPIVNTSRACPPGTTGVSVDNGCTDSTGATFIA